jgi:hypothetical protein
MQPIHRTLILPALALCAALAACSDTATAPRAPQDDPVVQQLNRLGAGQGRVLSVKKKDQVLRGVPADAPKQPSMLVRCDPVVGCDPEPVDRSCYSGCSWFDVDAYISYGSYGGIKWVQPTGTLYAYSGTASGNVSIGFYSAGGCVSSPSLFDSAYLSGSNGPFTLSASRYVEYTGGTFTWRVTSDGYAQNRYGRDGYEYTEASLCY